MTKNQLIAILAGTFVLALAFIGYVKATEPEIVPVSAPVIASDAVPAPTPVVADGVQEKSTWTFTLDGKSADTLNSFEVRNMTSGEVMNTPTIKDGVVSVDVTSKPGDVLAIQCWTGGYNDWCASNLHDGHIISATSPDGATYTVDRKAGDIHYVLDGVGQRYGTTVK